MRATPVYSLAGQLMGVPLKPLQGFGVPAESYGFANKLLAWETVAPLLDRASPLRTAHQFRGPAQEDGLYKDL
jgi:nicotinate dehydrogenase subunit B